MAADIKVQKLASTVSDLSQGAIGRQWRRSDVKYGGQGQSRQAFKLFISHPISMISKHSTMPVPDSLYGPEIISFTFLF